MGNDERPKMSWREIDKVRSGGGSSSRGSGSSHRSGGGPRSGGGGGGGRSSEDPHQKQYRAALEAAFAKGELGKLADKLNLLGRGSPSDEPSRPTSNPPASEKPSLSERMIATAERAVVPEPVPVSAEAAAADSAAKKKAAGKKKAGDDKPSLHRKLLEAPSRHEISKAAEKYLARFPMPDDHEFLEQLLDHEQDGRIKEALERITQLLDRRLPPRRTRALIGKLRYLTETNSDELIRESAQALLQRLS